MGDTNSDGPQLSECDDIDMDTLAFMLDEEGISEPEDEAADGSEPSTLAELGLVLSDDEEHQPSPLSKPASTFSAAFSQSKVSKTHPGKELNDATETVDPLESELREMEARVKLLQETLAKKKKLELKHSSKFTKLTITPDQPRKTNSRTLSITEESDLRKHLGRKSELHSGDTDSEDEEDNRNPMEQRYNTLGRDIKRRIAHESRGQRNERTEKVLTNKKGSTVERQGWKTTEGALVNIGKSGATSSQDTDKNVTLDAYSGIRIM